MKMNQKLTAREMIKLHQNPVKFVSINKLNKSVIPENTTEEIEKIHSSLEALKTVLSAERVERRQNRSEAIWLPENKIAKITRHVGGIIIQFCFTDNGDLYLHPNEALFLLETNRLELLWDDIPFSIEQAYNVLLESKESLENYRTFQELALKGYIIRKPEINKKRKSVQTSSVKKRKLDEIAGSSKLEQDNDEAAQLLELLKQDGPSSDSTELISDPLYNLYQPGSSIKDKEPTHEIVRATDNFSLECVSDNDNSLITSFTGYEAVSFFQLHKVDLKP